MSYNIFFTSDTHFGHAKMLTFYNYDGVRERPFDTVEECDELMIENWNKVVRPQDKVYFLGDLVLNKKSIHNVMSRLKGHKCLIRGNHDLLALKYYTEWFYDIRGCYNLDSYLMTHIPIHPDSKSRFKMNIHGHLHSNHVKLNGKNDLWYRNVCMDACDYKLVPYEQIQKEYAEYKELGLL